MAVARRIRRRGWMNAAKKTPQAPEPRRPSVPHLAVRSRTGGSLAEARVYVFDIEGTLVDTVLPSLNCWTQTLAEFGHTFRTADIHRYEGMDAEDMLTELLPESECRETRELVLDKYRWRMRTEVLPTLRAFPGVRTLIADLKSRGAAVALVTTARDEELAHYRSLIEVDDLVDTVVSGGEVERGMPHPDLLEAVLERLGTRHPGDALLIGDTPYDAEAAHHVRMRAVGMLSGLYAKADLVNAGCQAVFLDPRSLHSALALPEHAAAPVAAEPGSEVGSELEVDAETVPTAPAPEAA